MEMSSREITKFAMKIFSNLASWKFQVLKNIGIFIALPPNMLSNKSISYPRLIAVALLTVVLNKLLFGSWSKLLNGDLTVFIEPKSVMLLLMLAVVTFVKKVCSITSYPF